MNIRRYLPADRAAVIAALRASFDGWHGDLSEKYWEWKFERNPHGQPHIWVGDDEGTVAGCYVWNPVRLRIGDTRVLGAQSVDAAVHPDYQGRGLFTDLARAATEDAGDLELVYAFPTEAAFRGQLRVGFGSASQILNTYRPLHPGFLRRPRSGALEIRETSAFDERFDALAASRASGGIEVDRDAAYLRWRYAAHPVRRYETLICERSDELWGYCTLTTDTTRGRLVRGYVMDLQVVPGEDGAAELLVRHALQRLRQSGARVAITWIRPPSPERDALERYGFSRRYEALRGILGAPHRLNELIVYEPNASRITQLNTSQGAPSPSSWCLVPGDADYT